MNSTVRIKRISAVLILLLLVLAVCSLCIGNYRLTMADLIKYCIAKFGGQTYDRTTEAVLLNIRLVRVVAAVVIGSALAISGLVYQTVFSNNMVSPDLLGVSSSAACGAAIAIILGMPNELAFLCSFVFSIFAVLLTGAVSKLLKQRQNLLLAGIIVAGFAKSGLGLLKYLADSENGELESIVYWELGSLAKVTWTQLLIIAPLVIIIISIVFLSRYRMGCLVLGDGSALLGIHTALEKMLAIAFASLLVSLCTAVCGVINWVSLVIPIVSAELTRSGSIADNIVVTALLGSSFLLLSDDIARAATTSEIPISIMTGAAGLIIFCVAVFSGRRKKKV